jgi:hypothetical protein
LPTLRVKVIRCVNTYIPVISSSCSGISVLLSVSAMDDSPCFPPSSVALFSLSIAANYGSPTYSILCIQYRQAPPRLVNQMRRSSTGTNLERKSTPDLSTYQDFAVSCHTYPSLDHDQQCSILISSLDDITTNSWVPNIANGHK